MPEPESILSPRDRLSRIGALFLSDDQRQIQIALHVPPDDASPLRALELARALACLGHPVSVIETGRGMLMNLRLLPDADSFPVAGNAREPRAIAGRPRLHTAAQRDAEIVIIESTTATRADTTPFVLLPVPADAAGMRRAWTDLKILACGRPPAAVGATIIHAADLDEAEDCHARFAAAAERFLGIEVVSYACLLRDRQNRAQELRNIAALLVADLANGAGAAKPEDIVEETQ
jgi:hypothetical protein